jgi:hypothetical protein
VRSTGNTNNQAGVATASHFVINERSLEELRRAQLAIAGNVFEDPRLNDGWEREADLMDMLDYLGLFRRI